MPKEHLIVVTNDGKTWHEDALICSLTAAEFYMLTHGELKLADVYPAQQVTLAQLSETLCTLAEDEEVTE